MGNEAIALGAIRAGVRMVTGYPGTPSTEVLETIAKNNKEQKIYIEWSVNEKVALEVGAGAAYAGLRTLVTMKQVGLNVASDPLMCVNYVGVKGGLVLLVADDPGPISSQTEQDTRNFGQYAGISVFDPSTPEEAYLMILDAFERSEKYSLPVILRPTTRVCHSYAGVEILEDINLPEPEGFKKDNRWVIFPRLSYQNHISLRNKLVEMQAESYDYNVLTGTGKKGIVSGGVSVTYTKEALSELTINTSYKFLKLSTYPLDYKLMLEFLTDLDEVLVIEELDAVIEKELVYLAGQNGIKVIIKGKLSGNVQVAGENTVESVRDCIVSFLNLDYENDNVLPEMPPLPVRPPVLCAGCPHRASFFAVKEAVKGKKAVFSGDIGCYTLGNAKPLDMVDTCLCMGAGITVAQGLHRAEPDTLNFAFIGDSTFFHSGITGLINAVYNNTDIIVVILDNSNTAMTGSQPHPGIGKNMYNDVVSKVNIYDLVKAIGVSEIVRANPFDLNAAREAAKSVTEKSGVRVIIYEAPCIAVAKPNKPMNVNEKCTGCGVCIKKLGCPAISLEDKKIVINKSLCTGCGICRDVCKFGAIEVEKAGVNND